MSKRKKIWLELNKGRHRRHGVYQSDRLKAILNKTFRRKNRIRRIIYLTLIFKKQRFKGL